MRRNGCKRHVLLLDIYKKPFRLQLPDQDDQYRTLCGSLLSVITILLLFSYAIYKIDLMLGLKHYSV